jgi:hypothetical protein
LNRRRAEWSDTSRHELTGANGNEIKISERSDLDRARRIAYILSQAAATPATTNDANRCDISSANTGGNTVDDNRILHSSNVGNTHSGATSNDANRKPSG